MIKRIPLSLCLLSGILFTGNPVNAATPETSASTPSPKISQASTSTPIKLLLEDLPEGFQELPPGLAASLASQFRLLTQQFQQATLNPENLFAFVNPESFQIVLGFTLGIDMEGTPLQLDMATFRRGEMVAFTGVMYLNGQMPLIQLGDVAQKLDNRIVQVSAKSYPASFSNF